ncbi:MAG TPA: lysophospholipid acyltransferase family protein [Acidimicrobiales bacterium]|nr:lysophospholipid acyltransferase family protein [Acidimicrobiales bacterium]
MTAEFRPMSDTGYRRVKSVLAPVFSRLWPKTVTGLGNIPVDGPAILAPNHISFLDSVFLAEIAPRRVFFIGKAEYLDSWKTRYLFPALGMIPVDRRGGDAAEAALDAAASVLAAGHLFGIFPEGTRARDGFLHRGRTGVARLALRTGAPIVPVGIEGTDEIQPPDSRLPRILKPCTFRFGRAIDVSRFAGRQGDGRVLRQITDQVMYEVAELSGRTYVDTYAGRDVRTEPTGMAAADPPASAPAVSS